MSDPMRDASLSSLSPSLSHGEEAAAGEVEEGEEEKEVAGESIADLEPENPLHHQASVEIERLQQSEEKEDVALGPQRKESQEEEEDDDMDSDQAYTEREDFDSAAAGEAPEDHHTNMSEDYDPAEPLALEDLMTEKNDLEPEPNAEVEEEEEEEEAEHDLMEFLKRPPEEDDGTPEEQMDFVRKLERFFAGMKMEYRHPKFYGENLNCLKLWRAVVRLGGYDAVTAGKLWRQVGDTFKPPKSCTTVSWSFRGFYEKALLDYERYKMHGIFPGSGQDVAQHDAGIEGQANAAQPSTSQPSFLSSLGRARRDAASRAMQGWHSQRFFGNGDVGDPIIKEKGQNPSAKRARQLKMGVLKGKKATSFERAVQAARNKGSRLRFLDGGTQMKVGNWEEVCDPSYFSVQKKKTIKQEYAKQGWKNSGCNPLNGDDIWVADDGPKADWVKINVHKTRDCFEVYALVPGLLREEVHIQCEPGGQLVIAGEPEEPNNPWGVTSFKKIINLPLPIDATKTSAVVTLHGQLFVRVPYDQTHSSCF